MNTEFQECLAKFTKEHHEASGKATKAEEFQVRDYYKQFGNFSDTLILREINFW